MKPKLRLFAIHQTATSLQRTYNLNPKTIWYPALDEINMMKSTYFIIHLGKNPPPHNGCRLKPVFFFKKKYFSQNQPAAMITLNTSSPWTLVTVIASSPRGCWAGEEVPMCLGSGVCLLWMRKLWVLAPTKTNLSLSLSFSDKLWYA